MIWTSKEFAREERGAITSLGLFIFMSMVVIGGLALDVANAMMARTQLQVAADAAAHAALYTRELKSSSEAKTVALALAEVNMPNAKFGSVLTAEDIKFGRWDEDAEAIELDSSASDAVYVDISRLESKSNSVGTYFLRMAGFDSWDIRRGAVFETYLPTCFREGFVAEDIVDVQSNNSYTNGFCIHANTHVVVSSGNFFEDSTIVSMPDKRDLELPSSGFESNDGLQDSLRDSSYQIRILNRLEEIIDTLFVGGTPYTPDYIFGTGLIALPGLNVDGSDFEPGKIHTKACNGGQSLHIANGSVLKNVVLATSCKVNFGQGTTLENVIIATTNTSDKSISAASGVQVGLDDDCATGGGAQILSMGGMDFPADLKAYGGQLIAMKDISFSANANGIEGASFISGGTISGTSNMTMGFCGNGMENNFAALYFRMVQ